MLHLGSEISTDLHRKDLEGPEPKAIHGRPYIQKPYSWLSKLWSFFKSLL